MQKNILLFSLIILFSCSNKDKVKLEGKISNFQPNSKIFLYEEQVTESELLDSTELSSNGDFKFKFKITEPKFYFLRFSNKEIINLLISPGEKPVLNADASKLQSSVSVKGSEGTRLVLAISQNHAKVLNHLDSLVSVYKQINDKQVSKKLVDTLNNDYKNSKLEERKNVIKFIIENYKSMASIMALYLKYDSSDYVLQYPKDLQYYKIVSDTLMKLYPTSKQVKALKTDFDRMLRMQKSMVLQNMIKNAKVSIPEIALPNAKGDTIRITSLLGKIILLNFWSSESKACLMINRDYLYLYKKYRKSGLVIYQVSLESDKNKWLDAIKDIPWISVAEISKENSFSAKMYNVSQIPASFLIDQKGSFIGKNLNVTELDRAISGLIKK
jgi:peroxiredoxin